MPCLIFNLGLSGTVLINALRRVTGTECLETMDGAMGLRVLLCVCLVSLLTLQTVPALGLATGRPRGSEVCD